VFSAHGRIAGRIVDSAGHGFAGSTVLALHAPDLGMPIEPSSWWIAHLPLDVGDPIALGAEVPARATTNENGFFAFEDFEPGRVRLAVRSTRHDPVDRDDLWLAAGGTLSLPKIVVERSRSLSGRIFDPDGRPILRASIVLLDDFPRAGTPPLSPRAGVLLAETNARGYFDSLPVGPGPWAYCVSAGPDLADLVVTGASAQEGRDVDATLTPAATIRGRVRKATRLVQPMVVRAVPADPSGAGDTAIPFACRGDAREAPVLANFEFELRGLDEGAVYELRASESARPFEVDSSWSPPVLAAAGEERADLAWDADASVNFRLLAPGSREPVGCTATLVGLDPESASVAEPSAAGFGLSTIDGLRPRRGSPFRRLELARPGFLPLVQNLAELRPGYALALGDLELTPIPTMHVRVVDARTQRPIRGAWIVATENPADLAESEDLSGTATDAAGEARIPAFAGTATEIRVRARGYAPARRFGPFGAGFTEASLELALLQGATVKVRVVDLAGDPIPAARIEHVEGNWSPNEGWRSQRPFRIGEHPDARESRIADDLGATVFEHVAPGRHAFRLQRYRGFQDSEWTLRELAEGETSEIVLVSQAPAQLELRVTDGLTGSGSLAGAPVAIVRGEDAEDPIGLIDPRSPLPPCLSGRLDDWGKATFANVLPGLYLALIDVPGQELRSCRELNVAEGGSRIEIDLARKSIAGTVAHVESGPVAGAEVLVVVWDRRETRRSATRLRDLGYLGDDEIFASGLEVFATTSDDAGRFRIVGLPERERYFVIARSGPHWSGTAGPIEIATEGPETVADVSIQPAGALEVRIGTRPAIVPCVLAAVSQQARSRPRLAHTFSGGAELLDGLEPGTWDVFVDAGGLGMRHERVEVVAGETSILEFALP